VIAASSDFDSVKVEWSSQRPALGTYDLLVYFVASRSDSVLVKGKLSSTPSLGDTGTPRSGERSRDRRLICPGIRTSPKRWANSRFHELMHNVCLMKDGLHKVPGVSLGQEEIKAETELNDADIQLLNKHLKKERRQWKDGYNFKPQKGDPLADPFG